MSEFIKIKNMRGTGDMLVRISIIGAAYDKAEGGAVIEADIAGEGMKINTASTAAEVLAAIEGAQTVTGVMAVGGGNNGISSYGPGDVLYSTAEVTPCARPTKAEPAPYPLDCTCRNLISGHDPDCPWHGG